MKTEKKIFVVIHRCRRRASNDCSHDWTSSQDGIRLFSESVASVVRRRMRFAARDLKSFALKFIRRLKIFFWQIKKWQDNLHCCCFGFLFLRQIRWISRSRYTTSWIIIFTDVRDRLLKRTKKKIIWTCSETRANVFFYTKYSSYEKDGSSAADRAR